MQIPRTAAVCLIGVALLTACAHPKPLTPAGPSAAERLKTADALVREGCLECLENALRTYDDLRRVPGNHVVAAAAGAVRAGALIAIRQRELGMVEEGALDAARQVFTDTPEVDRRYGDLLDIADALPNGVSAISRSATTEEELDRSIRLRRNHDAWLQRLRESAGVDDLAAYLLLSLACIDSRELNTETLGAVGSFEETGLAVFKQATCRRLDVPVLARLRTERRFAENAYFVGMANIGARRLDDAEQRFAEAYAWRPRWPSLTLAMGTVAMTGEDFARAQTLYAETLQSTPHAVEALLGLTRALTYLGRHEEAIATTDRLLAERWFRGDALYWKALNEAQLERYDAAWDHVEEAATLLINAEVPKLAGLVAYRRQQLDVARARFEVSRARNQRDCETGFYLGTVLAEQRQWDPAATVLVDTARCIDQAEEALLREIDEIRTGDQPPERQDRLIRRREQQIAAGRRMRVTSWFNAAVAYFSLSRAADARSYAERVVDDDQFGERAREILARLK